VYDWTLLTTFMDPNTKRRESNTTKSQPNIKEITRGIIVEFVESGDVEEAMEDIKKNKLIEGPAFVKEAVIFGMEHNSYERERISQLLAQAYNIFLSHDIQNGFQLLLDRLPDLVLDVPTARELLGKFIARAIFDEILAPAFLKEAQLHNKEASHVVSLAYETTNAPEKKRLDKIWGAGAMVSVRRLRKEVRQILEEYINHQDAALAVSSIGDLNTPHFNVEVVKKCFELSLEQNSLLYAAKSSEKYDKGKLLHLISVLESAAIVSKHDVEQALKLVSDQLADISLDIPHAKEILVEIVKQAKIIGIIAENF